MHNRISITEDVIRFNNYLEVQGSGVFDCQILHSASVKTAYVSIIMNLI